MIGEGAHCMATMEENSNLPNFGEQDIEKVKQALNWFVKLQGLLARFKEPEVRHAFLEGQFMVKECWGTCDETKLHSLDKIRELLLPYPGYADTEQRSSPESGPYWRCGSY